MKEQLAEYRKLQQDLMSQLTIAKKNKVVLTKTTNELHQQYSAGTITQEIYSLQMHQFLKGRTVEYWYNVYDEHITKCEEGLLHYAGKINEASMELEGKKSVLSKAVIALVVLGVFFSFMIFIPSGFTGLFVFTDTGGGKSFEDGYSVEGTKWMDIKGSRLYERCLQVKAVDVFSTVKLAAKATVANDKEDLVLTLYHDEDEEPSSVIGSCKVKKYDTIWKSCTIKGFNQEREKYWICASSPGGERTETYHTIAYHRGDNKKTALWTGKNWQKLAKSSYTIKAEFQSNG